jgi:CRISPR-associated protein Cas1
MKKTLYLTNEGVVKRDGNTIYFENKNVRRALPIENISEIQCMAYVTFTSESAFYLMKMGIPVNFFNKYGYYVGSLYPREKLNSGHLIVKQVEHYLDPDKRNFIATEMVSGIKHNILKNLKYYFKTGKDVSTFIESIEGVEIEGKTIPEIMNKEGLIWSYYYKSFNYFIRDYEMKKRTYHPPEDELNALISFGNSLLYSTTLSEIYNTYLHPSISYLHEPSERRFSLALDLADIFKPLIVDRVVFNLINNKIINKEDFSKDSNFYLKEDAKRKFLKLYDEKLETTVMHKNLKRKVSYRHLIRLEAYKLIKHILGDKEYKSFKMWW